MFGFVTLLYSPDSVFETIVPLEDVGLVVKDVVVLLDREQGGKSAIQVINAMNRFCCRYCLV